MALDAAVVDQLSASAARSILRQTDHADEVSRQVAYGSAFDMRALGGALAGAMIGSDDPQAFARLNSGVRVPNTLDHYALGGGWGGGAGANSGPPGKAA